MYSTGSIRRVRKSIVCTATLLALLAAGPSTRAGELGLEFLGQWGGETYALAVVDSIAYVSVGRSLYIVDVSNPGSTLELGHTGTLSGIVTGVAVEGTVVYVSTMDYPYDGALEIIDASNLAAPTPVGHYSVGDRTVALAARGSHVYLVSEDGRLRIFDVSDPVAPAEIGSARAYGEASAVTLAGDLAYVGTDS